MIVAAKRVGEPLWNRGVLAFFPQRHHHELAVLRTAEVHQVPTLEVGHEDRPAWVLPDAARRMRACDPRGDLGLRVERPAHALAKPLGRVVGHCDKHQSPRYRHEAHGYDARP
jgi:hypothetical protein